MDNKPYVDDKKIQNIKDKRRRYQQNKDKKNCIIDEDDCDEEKYIEGIKEGDIKAKHFEKFDQDDNEFTPFDLNEENEEGYFDENNHYIIKKEEIDPWYESVKDNAKKTELLNKKRQRKTNDNEDDNSSEIIGKVKEKAKEKEEKEYSKYGEEDLYYVEERISEGESKEIMSQVKEYRQLLVDILISSKETVNQAIKRLKQVMTKNPKDEDAQKNFDKLLEIISKLTELSYFDVYNDTISKIVNDLSEKEVFRWKYRVIITEDGHKEMYELFTRAQMEEWYHDKMFDDQDNYTFEFCIVDPRDKGKEDIEEYWFNQHDDLFKEFLNIKADLK